MSTKQDLLNAVIPLFASQGYEATTTIQMAKAANVTEPVIYYYFKNKEGLFTHILIKTFAEYFNRLDSIETETATQFEKIENLIDLHFQFVDNFPNQIFIIVSTCPAKLRDSAHTCAQQNEAQRLRLTKFISECLEEGIKSGEFHSVDVEATTGFILASVNGLLRRRSLKLDQIDGLKEATIEFCRRSLVTAETESGGMGNRFEKK